MTVGLICITLYCLMRYAVPVDPATGAPFARMRALPLRLRRVVVGLAWSLVVICIANTCLELDMVGGADKICLILSFGLLAAMMRYVEPSFREKEAAEIRWFNNPSAN